MIAFEVKNLSVARGGANVVHELSFHAPAGEVTVLLGPNGAGKTTLLEALSGVILHAAGSIAVEGCEVQTMSRVNRARKGLGHVQQGRVVFPTLTVAENLRVGARGRSIESAFEMFPELTRRRHVLAGQVSGGEQQMIVIGRAILNAPKVLLIDEMSLGLAPIVVRRLMTVIRALANEGLAVLLVEQFDQLALSIGGRAMVMTHGRISDGGPCSDLRNDKRRLHNAYLGISSENADSPDSTLADAPELDATSARLT